MRIKFTRSLLSSALLLASTQIFAATPTPIVPYGSGVYFYAWNANEYCGVTPSNPSGACPEKWTDTVKNINAQIPAGADKAQIKYIYLDSITFNWNHSPTGLTGHGNSFSVGGCDATPTPDITFCSNSGGLNYSTTPASDGNTAVDQLANDMVSGYYIMPMISDARDQALMSMTQAQLQGLATALASIVNGDSNISGIAFDVENPDFSGRHYPGTFEDPNSASDFYKALQTAIGTSGTKFIMVSRGPGGLLETNDGNQATAGLTTFGETLSTLNKNAGPKFIFSPQIYDLCDGMGNTTTSWACPIQTPFDLGMDAKGLASPISGLGKPIAGAYYNNYEFLQPIPNTPIPGSTPTAENTETSLTLSWPLFFPDGKAQDQYNSLYTNPLNDLPIKSMSMPYLFKAELEGKSFAPDISATSSTFTPGSSPAGYDTGVISSTQYPASNMTNTNPISPPYVPVQLTISGGASSQIWEHVNLYNVDSGPVSSVNFPNLPSTTNPKYPTVDYYRYPTQFDSSLDVQGDYRGGNTFNNYDANWGYFMTQSYYAIPFTPNMIYTNKQFCQYENPNGSSGATIPNCISYKNPYGETVASYANALFTTLQYALANDSAKGATQTNAPFYGVAMYPFTPYGYFDKACAYDATNNPFPCHAGFFPEIPDGLVNGQKPETSFWKTYIGQFANQWTGSSTGTIPTAQSNSTTTADTTAPETLLSLSQNYYANNNGTATVNFSVSQYPATGTPSTNVNSYRAKLVDATGAVVASSDQGGSCNSTSCTIPSAPGGNYTLELQALDANGGVITEVDAAANGGGTPPVPAYSIDGLKILRTPSKMSYTLTWTLHCTTPPSGVVAMSQLYLSNGNPAANSISTISPLACGQESATFTPNNSKYPFSPQSKTVSLYVVNGKTLQSITPPVATIPISITN